MGFSSVFDVAMHQKVIAKEKVKLALLISSIIKKTFFSVRYFEKI